MVANPEKIFLDCVDYDVCTRTYKLGYIISIHPYDVSQEYSVDEIPKLQKGKLHFVIRLKDMKEYNRQHYYSNKFFLCLLYTLRSKDIQYLSYLFK